MINVTLFGGRVGMHGGKFCQNSVVSERKGATLEQYNPEDGSTGHF